MDSDTLIKYYQKTALPLIISLGIGAVFTHVLVGVNASMYWHGVTMLILGLIFLAGCVLTITGYFKQPGLITRLFVVVVMLAFGIILCSMGINVLGNAWDGYWIQETPLPTETENGGTTLTTEDQILRIWILFAVSSMLVMMFVFAVLGTVSFFWMKRRFELNVPLTLSKQCKSCHKEVSLERNSYFVHFPSFLLLYLMGTYGGLYSCPKCSQRSYQILPGKPGPEDE